MTLAQVRKLQSGDEVFWNDPDNGICSKYIVISSIEIHDKIVRISGQDGTELECFARELT